MEATFRTTPHRPRVIVALAGALSLTAAGLAMPGAVIGAQGDNEVVIDVIEQATPAIVTIQTPSRSVRELRGQLPEDFELPEDLELPEGFELPEGAEIPRDLEDLEELLPEGFELPEGFSFPERFGLPDGFGFPEGFQGGGTGSGVIIDPAGLIITNGHVVGDAEQVTVILDDGSVYDGTVTGVDTLTDFAFVEVEVEGVDLPAVPLGDSSMVRVGQLAIAIGNPLGQFPGSAASGIISGLDRTLGGFGTERLDHLIQTDAAINSGNSGGALFNGDGELIGITTAQAGLNDGIGFALPIDLAKPIIEQALTGEEITRPYIGVVYREVDAQVADQESLPVTSGAWIGGAQGDEGPVVAGSPADAAGLQAGDIITAVDGLAVDRDNPLDLQVLRFAPGDEITLEVLRDGESIELPTTLGTRPADLNG